LFRSGDTFHPNREGGPIKPRPSDVPPEYQDALRWYEKFYDEGSSAPRVDLMTRAYQHSPKTEAVSRPIQNGERGEDLRSGASSAVLVRSNGDVTIPLNLREELGILAGTRVTIQREESHLVLQPVTDEFIHSLRGCCKGEGSMIEDREREHRIEKDRLARE
jgi:bifunctional DNA-binding transcriptional regulator/antitoxin component of YhaV-PrlF toxin-antitoxin module